MENIYDINRKLLGAVEPQGESNIDRERFENLVNTCNLIELLLRDIHYVAQEKNRYESSIKKAGKYAYDFLQQIKEEL